MPILSGLSATRITTAYSNWEMLGVNVAASRGTTITSGLINAKGAYVELIAATTKEIKSFVFFAITSNEFYLFDIALGAAGSEVNLITNLPLGVNTAVAKMVIDFPLLIPLGSRISIRSQASAAAQIATIAILGGSA